MATTEAKTNITFLIVPGSFSTPPAYESLANLLRAQGHEADIVGLLSANDGTRQPPATAEDDAAHIRQAVLAVLDDPARPRDVVLMAHSYGGVPTSSAPKGLGRADRAAEGKSTAVVAMAYVAAFVLPLGVSNRAYMNSAGAFDGLSDEVRLGVPGGYMPRFDPVMAPVLFPDLPPAEAAWAVGLMTAHSSDSFDGVVAYEAWRDIPSVMLIPEKDQVIPTPLLEKMYEDVVARGGEMARVLVEGAGHMLPIARPEFVAAELFKLAEDR